MHHPPATSLSYLDEPDSLLDALLSEDLGDPLASFGAGPAAGCAQQQQQEQQPGSGGTSGASGLVPSVVEHAGGGGLEHRSGGLGGHHSALAEAQVVPQPHMPAVAPAYRNGGFGGPVVAAAPADVLPAVKLDTASFLS